MNLNSRALGLTLGLLWGLTVLISTWWLLIIGSLGKTIIVLSNFYFGYTFSWFGGIVGFVWGFVDGFICGFLIAWVYNYFNKSKTSAQ